MALFQLDLNVFVVARWGRRVNSPQAVPMTAEDHQRRARQLASWTYPAVSEVISFEPIRASGHESMT